MHPLIATQLDTLNNQIGRLAELLQAKQDELDNASKHKDELQREQFRQRKHSVTIGHMTEDLEANQETLETYETERTELRDRLETLLASAKGLRGALGD